MKLKARSQKALRIIRQDGFVMLLIVSLQKLRKEQQKVASSPKIKIRPHFLASQEDVLRATWAIDKPRKAELPKHSKPYTFNWVMSPPDVGGGHQNIFRFILYLEAAGHNCRVYLYSTFDFPSVSEIEARLARSYPNLKASVEWLKGDMKPADGLFATGWETAYPVYNDPQKCKRFYFVQDFEPSFYSLGSEYVLAENTYRMGFYGITAGGWLADKLSKDYDMQTDSYEFGANMDLYNVTNTGKRKEVFFYARPVTVRRGFELGIMALDLFHKQLPDYTITMAGWDVSDYVVPFPYNNLKTLQLDQLSDVYNRCAAGLVISLTNMSLLPLELLAAGTIPIVTDGPNNWMVSNNPYIAYASASPDALAKALVDTVTRKDLPSYAKAASKSVDSLSWDVSGAKFVKIVERELHG